MSASPFVDCFDTINTMFARSLRTIASTSRCALPRVMTRAVAPRVLPRSAFHTTRMLRGQGETDVELSYTLGQEIAHEKQSADPNEPEFLTDFKSAGIWRIDERPGADECVLTREFGNEHIRVLFSIGDIDTKDMEDLEDQAAENEEGEGAEPAAAEEAQEEAEQEEEPGFPVRLAITISKPGKGALTVDAQAQDGEIYCENIAFFKNEKDANELTAEADWARRGLYIGPQFDTLDKDVQIEFEAYLAERGIDQNLALFVPSLAEYKEQKEYCNWLSNVKEFIDA